MSAEVKVSTQELSTGKSTYLKASKNMKTVADKVKQVRNQLGGDKMLEEARSALTKLAELLDNRAAGLEILSKALETASQSYTERERKAVSKSNNFKAHSRDFYGNPVAVGGGGGGGAAAGISAGAAAAPAAAAPEAAAPEAAPQTINLTENNVVVNQYIMSEGSAAGAASSGLEASLAGMGGISTAAAGIGGAAGAAIGAAAALAGKKFITEEDQAAAREREYEKTRYEKERLQAELEKLKEERGK